MSLTMMNRIKKIQRQIVWAQEKDEKKIAWASWEIVCKSKDEGGLGVKDIRQFNIILLSKWIWKLGTKKEGQWKEVLESKYDGGEN